MVLLTWHLLFLSSHTCRHSPFSVSSMLFFFLFGYAHSQRMWHWPEHARCARKRFHDAAPVSSSTLALKRNGRLVIAFTMSAKPRWTSIASQACVDAVSVDVAQKSPRSNRQCPNDKSVVFGRCVFTSNAVIPLPYFVCACVLKTTSDPVWCMCHSCCVSDHGSGVRFSCSARHCFQANLREDHGEVAS